MHLGREEQLGISRHELLLSMAVSTRGTGPDLRLDNKVEHECLMFALQGW